MGGVDDMKVDFFYFFFPFLPVVRRNAICQTPLAKIVRAQPLVFDD